MMSFEPWWRRAIKEANLKDIQREAQYAGDNNHDFNLNHVCDCILYASR